MKELNRDILVNIFQTTIKIYPEDVFMVDGNFFLSEPSKKYFLESFAQKENDTYNDYAFVILNMHYDFKNQKLSINFGLGAGSYFHEVTI